jgi:hypothetical protein
MKVRSQGICANMRVLFEVRMAQRTGRTDLACPRYQCDAVCMDTVGYRAHGWTRRLGARTVLQILDIDGVVDHPILVQFIPSDLAVPFELVGEQEWRRVTLGGGTDMRMSSAAPENLTDRFLIAEGAHTRCPGSERQHREGETRTTNSNQLTGRSCS